MRGEVVDEMIDRARRIVDDERNQTHLGKWAEALLAERAAREEAERERDQAWTEAARSRDEASAWFNKRADAERRAERAERERDEAARFGESTQDWLRARVADLEAANECLAEWLSECAGLLHGLWRTPEEFFPVSAAIGDALTRWAKHPSHLIADALAGGSR